MSKQAEAMTNLEILQIPVPPMLEDALGYDGEARWVAFYWSPAGDEAMFDDGRASGDGDWWGWLAYVDHPAVDAHLWQKCPRCDGEGTTNTDPCDVCDGAGLLPLNLGSSDFEADQWLVIDRQERRAYAATVAAARRFLWEQWPPPPELSPEEQELVFEAFRKAVAQVNREWTPPSDEELRASSERKRAVCASLTAWLDDAAEIIEELAPVHGLETTLELIRIDDKLVVAGR